VAAREKARYIRGTLRARLLAGIFLLAACPHPHGGGGAGTGTASGTAAHHPEVTPDAAPVVRQSGQPMLPADGVACPAMGCVYHAGANAYFACLSGGAGICFHFGSPCEPRDSCMFDAADGMHHHCDQVTDGKCAQWGDLCDPG